MIRVLVVDDSAVFRKVIARELVAAGGIEVVGFAADPYQARERIVECSPDVITLDVEMPRMGGLTFLEKLMKQHPIPVVLVSSLGQTGGATAIRALALGAVNVVEKTSKTVPLAVMGARLRSAVRAAAVARPQAIRPTVVAPRQSLRASTSAELVALGASTGGTIAISRVLRDLPADFPPVVIVIHMPQGFTAPFAKRLDAESAMCVREAKDHEVCKRGTALVAPAGAHAEVVRVGTQYQVKLSHGPPVCHHRPSVDVLFHSVAKHVGKRAAGALLTGMGQDGAEGLLHMRECGAFTIAEAKETCVIFGMPRVAIEMGGASRVVPLPGVAFALAS